tara:strand:+ start:1413 stop:2195 length:783 start_codon:yes stop_codon:yes gene_type:complete
VWRWVCEEGGRTNLSAGRSNMFRAFLSRLCKLVKHFLLDLAHPPPSRIYLFPGEGIQRVIMDDLVDEVELSGLVILDAPSEVAGHSMLDVSPPTVCFASDDVPVGGLFSILRYLSRLWRVYPTTPENALRVDSAIEDLHRFIRPWVEGAETPAEDFDATAWVMTHVQTFEERYLQGNDTEYIYGFSTKSMADICWGGAFRYIVEDAGFDDGEEFRARFPLFTRWWEEMKPEYVVQEEGDGDETEEGDGDGDDTEEEKKEL